MKKTYLDWPYLLERAENLVANWRLKGQDSQAGPIKVYGVPKGGMLAAGMVFAKVVGIEAVHCPHQADVIVDDIIDSGATFNKWRTAYPLKPFYALINKQHNPEHKDMGWVVFPWERAEEHDDIQDNIVRVLQYIGEDAGREGLLETPKRVVKSWSTIFGGYTQDPKDHMKTFTSDADEMVIASFEFYSMCEHHMIPFFGKAHVAYIPNGKVIGVSKLARIFDVYARRLQIQEQLGQQVVNALQEGLNPLGVAVAIEAQHMCMTMRGVEKQSAMMRTSCLSGAFKDNHATREEFFSAIR